MFLPQRVLFKFKLIGNLIFGKIQAFYMKYSWEKINVEKSDN
jgi:hypothetical protein